MKLSKLHTLQKLHLSFLIILLFITVPFSIFACYALQTSRQYHKTLMLFFISVCCMILAFLIAYFRIIRSVVNISKASSEIFKSYIESSDYTANEEYPENDLNDSDDATRLMRHVQKLLEKEYTAEMLRKQAELNALQSQINPHFLYNTLESIRGQAIYEGVNTIADMSKSLSDFFRYSIQSKTPLVQLKEELRIVESYVKIQNYRFNNKYEIKIQLDDDSLKEITIPRLTLQPLVENALIHGLKDSIKQKELVLIKAFSTQRRIVITVVDHGCGIDGNTLEMMNAILSRPLDINTENVKNAKSIGLNNINERIKLHYGNEYGIKLFSSLNYGTTVEISLPAMECTHESTPCTAL